VMGYEAWSYWVFRRRISTHHIPGAPRASDPLSQQL
jgi:cytochrome d ubiquinol oxidase subunit II